jgi:hypothetical protein
LGRKGSQTGEEIQTGKKSDWGREVREVRLGRKVREEVRLGGNSDWGGKSDLGRM